MQSLKPFDPALFKLTDRRARDAAIAWWKLQGYSATDNPNKYGPDLIVTGDGDDFYVEVETKLGWKDCPFPFLSVNIPGRKRKFAEIPDLIFMVFNKTYSRFVMINSDIVLNSDTKIINTRITENEEFFDVPFHLCGEKMI
jgi:hypothetical protein